MHVNKHCEILKCKCGRSRTTMSKRRQYRRRDFSEEEEDEKEKEGSTENDDVGKALEEMKELQKFRKRPAGVSAVGLAFGKKFTEEEAIAPDPFKLKTGGLVDLKDITASELKEADDEVVQKLHANFSAETKTLDNEAHMLSYIETEMSKRKAVTESQEDQSSSYEQKIKALYQVPEHLEIKKKEQSEEMLSNQMLSGIPEVDLGLEAKFRNIEETEKAKQLLKEQELQKKTRDGSSAPKHAGTSFTLHSLRFYKGKKVAAHHAKEEEKPTRPEYIPVVGENEPELMPTGHVEGPKRKLDQAQMATDDLHYDRFKKKARMF